MKRLFIVFVLALLLGASSAAAYPWYSNHCTGCSGTYYNTWHPHTQYYYSSYTYGYYGWGNQRVSYNYRFPHYNYYHPHRSHYPYAYSYYPTPMYRSGWHGGGYGPGIIW